MADNHTSPKLQCVMHRDGYDCDGKSKVFLTLYADGTHDLYCETCIQSYKKGNYALKVFEIGDDVTANWF